MEGPQAFAIAKPRGARMGAIVVRTSGSQHNCGAVCRVADLFEAALVEELKRGEVKVR